MLFRSKDGVRDEKFLTQDTTIFVKGPSKNNESNLDPTLIIIPIIFVVGIGIYIMRRRKKTKIEAS